MSGVEINRCPNCGYIGACCVCDVTCADAAPISEREREILAFSGLVCQHVGEYAVLQYGDIGEDSITDWSARDCEVQIEKYVKRFRSNQRGFEDAQRDLLKIAHYAGIVYNKRLAEKANHDATGIV